MLSRVGSLEAGEMKELGVGLATLSLTRRCLGSLVVSLNEWPQSDCARADLKRQCLIDATLPLPRKSSLLFPMAPMKSMKAAVKSLSKGGIAEAVASETELKKSEVTKVLNSLANVAAKEVKKGKFVIPGVCMIKTRLKPATKAGKREIFGKMCVVKAKPAKTVVKAFPVAALKKSV